MNEQKLAVDYVDINLLQSAEYNPRKWDKAAISALTESMQRFGMVDPIVANKAPERLNVVIGGHFRLKVAKDLGFKQIPVVYINISDIEKEKELNLRLNRSTGDWDWDLLKVFDESLLSDVGFSSEELDDIFAVDPTPEEFNIREELRKLDINGITMLKGDIYDLDGSRLMCGDSTVEPDMLTLMSNEKADMCFTDPPYLLDYLKGKKRVGKPTEGFGLKRDRKYLETDSLPDNFTELWMNNISKVQKPDFSIIAFENWKNIRIIWGEMEKHWKIKNMIVWHLPNRVQGFAAKYKFFNKHDIAMVGSSDTDIKFNFDPEETRLQQEYETALYAISGKPHWEKYEKGKRIQPTDFVEHAVDEEKSSGQGIIFGTKPVEILIPYIKVLTKRGDLIVEPFGGSGSTLIAATILKRHCHIMEKVPTYVEVIIKRWEKFTGKKAWKIACGRQK